MKVVYNLKQSYFLLLLSSPKLCYLIAPSQYMAPLEFKVTGSATVTRRAERCTLTLAISSSGPSQGEVSQNVKSTTITVNVLLKELAPKDKYGDPTPSAVIAVFSMTPLRTCTWIPQNNDGNRTPRRQYNANVRFEVIFQNFIKLGEVIATVSKMPHVEIENMDWRLTDATRANLASEVRNNAMQDAVDKARDYAKVVGRVVAAVEIWDEMVTHGRMTKQTPRIPEATSSMDAVSGIALEPEDVQMSLNVQVKFLSQF